MIFVALEALCGQLQMLFELQKQGGVYEDSTFLKLLNVQS
jgi:hypothetical protein